MGLTSISKDYSEPTFVQFEVVRKYQDTPEEETFLEPFIDQDEGKKVSGSEYISSLLSVSWGNDHCLMVDKKNRVYSTGFNRYGRLGHGDE